MVKILINLFTITITKNNDNKKIITTNNNYRFSPGEWDNPHPCSPEVDILENSLTPANSLWFVFGTFLCQGEHQKQRTFLKRALNTVGTL